MERYGTPEVLELRDVPTPTPRANEVLVRVHAASVNDWDWGLLRGTPFVIRILHGLFAPKVRIIGGDIAGHVEAVGEDVKRFRPGDEVYGDLCMSGFGAFAEYACALEASLALKPPGMTFEQAAAIPQAGMLAVQGLIDVGGIRSGQKVLVNGAGGGVGTFALLRACAESQRHLCHRRRQHPAPVTATGLQSVAIPFVQQTPAHRLLEAEQRPCLPERAV
ncbi:MAG TPA: NAD(P)-dependent alcohol dehydrogenase [Vicinamibacterales bacterium]|nr:NAD(P)-dependent alcohol dehydrogenase [Vicinamibacterales bacterium]